MTLPNLAALVDKAAQPLVADRDTTEARIALKSAAPDMAALLIECAEALAEIANPNARKAREGQPHPSAIARAVLARLADFDRSIG